MSTEAPFSLSFKTDESYASGIVTVRADTSLDLSDRLSELTEDLVQQIVDTKSLILAVNVATTGLATPAPVSAAPSATVPQQQVQGGDPNVKTCAHGVRQFKSGTSSRGPWTAWMCPLPRNASGKCDPLWG